MTVKEEFFVMNYWKIYFLFYLVFLFFKIGGNVKIKIGIDTYIAYHVLFLLLLKFAPIEIFKSILSTLLNMILEHKNLKLLWELLYQTELK